MRSALCNLFSTALIWFFTPVISPQGSLAQMRAVDAMEILLEDDERPYFLLPCDDAGVLIYRNIEIGQSLTEKKWEVRLFDPGLGTVWNTLLMTSNSQTIIGGYYDAGFVYFLLLDYAKMGKRYLMLRMDIQDRSVDSFELGDYVPEILDFLRVHNGSVLLGGTDKNKPSIVCYRYGSRRPVVLEGVYGRNNSILGIDLLEEHGFIVYIGKRTTRKSRSVAINQYSDAGELQSQIELKPGSDRLLLDCRMLSEIDFQHPSLGAGVYSSDNNTTANGIFTVLIQPNGAQEFKYYSFENLRNFFEYLPPGEREKRVRRIDARRQKGKKDVHKEYVLLRKPQSVPDASVMIGECYMRNNKVYDPYYGWETGFLFSHAFYIGIKEDGRVVWDNSMEIESGGEVSELQKTFVQHTADGFTAFSYSDPDLYYKHLGVSVPSDTVHVAPQRIPLFDRPATYADMAIRKWHGGNYILFGVRGMGEGAMQERRYTIVRLAKE